MVVVAIIGILALIAVPNFINLYKKTYDTSAKSAGRNAQTALEIYYNHQTDVMGEYPNELGPLLEIDRNLTDDPGVTFLFVYASSSGYTLHTSHAQGTGMVFVFHD